MTALLDKLADRLGVVFQQPRLIESALVHRSYLHERPDRAVDFVNSERLEFLGDSIVNYLAAELVFARFPESGEGRLTAMRAALINTRTLAGFARELELGAYLRLSKGEDASGARTRDSMLADTFEALVAAIYLDQGLDAARALVLPFFEGALELIAAHGLRLDYKSRLQEHIQAERNITPIYRTVDVTGPDHQREFTVEVLVGGEQLGLGRGPSKQAAAQEAARSALEQIEASP